MSVFVDEDRVASVGVGDVGGDGPGEVGGPRGDEPAGGVPACLDGGRRQSAGDACDGDHRFFVVDGRTR